MGRGTTVDMLSLADFHATLKGRLAEVDAVLAKLNNELACKPPALGTFTDANVARGEYEAARGVFTRRATQLRSAILAAQDATEQILKNYRTTEARNAADAREIASALGGVHKALERNGSPHA